MPFAKLAASITLIIILIIPIPLVFSSLSSTMHVKDSVSLLLPLSYAEIRGLVIEAGAQHGVPYIEAIGNNISSLPLQSANPVQGTLIVTEKVVNEGGGNKKPSDFTITVHGNNPSPISFHGSSTGTAVKLQMGMYSVTEAGLPGYNSTLSGDCSGGMMSVETRNCTITNMYSKESVGAK
jgi:prealbumin domain-containing protein